MSLTASDRYIFQQISVGLQLNFSLRNYHKFLDGVPHESRQLAEYYPQHVSIIL